MALPATLVVEVRPTNGTADGGGGFDPAVASPGTDFSQQNAVQVAFTDLVVGTPNTTVTSAGNPFDSTHVGNTIAITTTGGGGAWTVGLYNIRSVAVGVATLDRSPAATGSTAGVGNLGGARSGFSNGVTAIQGAGVLTAGTIIYVKKEAWNEAVAFAQAGAAGSPIRIIGYNSARDDIGLGSGNANNPVNNRASAAGDAISVSATHVQFHNINATGAGDAGFSVVGAIITFMRNCRSYSNTGEALETSAAATLHQTGCEFDGCASGIGTAGNALTFYAHGNYIHDNSSFGATLASGVGNFTFNVFDTNASHSIQLTTGLLNAVGNTFYNTTGANTDHINATTPVGSTVINNIFSSAARYGVNATDSDSIFEDYNDFNANGTAPRNPATGSAGGWGPATHDVTTDPTFTNAGAGDFSVGTNMKAAGWPGVFPAGLSTGYLDLGAVQRQEPSASGGIRLAGIGGFAVGGT